jgi:two-component system, sensor histidine kinase PdtaS
MTKPVKVKSKTLLLIFSLFVTMIGFGQDINRKQADSMLSALKTKKQGMERIDLLLDLAQFHIFKPGEQQIDFDSAKALIDEATSLNKTVHTPEANGYLALTESYLLKEKGQKKESRTMVEKAVQLLETSSNKNYLGRAYYELSRHYGYGNSEELRTRIGLVEQAIHCFEQAGTLDQNAYSLEMLGDLYNFNEQYDKALPVLNNALAAYIRVGSPKLQGVYVLLGQTNSYLRNYAQALFYMLKALKTAQTLGDTSIQMCQINLSVGVIYQRIDNLEMSAKYLSEGLEIAKRHRDEEAIFFLTVNISFVYNDLGHPDSALRILNMLPEKIRKSEDLRTKNHIALCYLKTYTALGQFDKARNYCDTLLYYIDNEAVKDLQITAYTIAAQYFISIKQFQEARYYLQKNMEMHQKKPLGLSRIKDEQLWYKLDSAQGNFQSAFNHLHFYKSKMDSVFSLNKVRQLQVLEIEYETALKEDSIKAKNRDIDLLTQKNTLQASNLRQASLIKNITIIGIILVLIIMGLLYRQYLNKQKSNNIITQKNELLQQIVNEKEWLLKEIHHRVKNNLQIIMSLLDSQSAYIDDNTALAAINDSQRRVQAISLIHQKLYQSENTASIDMRQYIDELVSYLRDSFGEGNRRIAFKQDIEPVKLDVAKAIPLGLIINEGIVNAIKYAFPNRQQGIVSISLKKVEADQLVLTIADNGTGLPAGIEVTKQESLGFSLMQGLTKQLGGNINIESNKGLHISIHFSALNNHEYE